MHLTRAQCQGLWALAAGLAIDVDFHITLQDNYGAILVEATSPVMLTARKFKIPQTGGVEHLQPRPTPIPLTDEDREIIGRMHA